MPTSASSQNLNDEDLATWLKERLAIGHAVGYVHRHYVCKVFDRADPNATLHPADPKKRNRLQW